MNLTWRYEEAHLPNRNLPITTENVKFPIPYTLIETAWLLLELTHLLFPYRNTTGLLLKSLRKLLLGLSLV